MNAAPGGPAPPVDTGRHTVVVRRGGVSLRWRVRTVVVCALLAAAATGVTAWALTLGDYPVALPEVWAALTGDPAAGFAREVVVDWRLPRALAAVVFGGALGASGAVFQSLTRNPLASPDIIGFSTGAYTGALVVITVAGNSFYQVAGGAVVGGLATAAFVYLLAWRRGLRAFRLIIVGIAVSAMLGSVNTWLVLTAELEVAMSAAVWSTGSLAGTGWEQAAIGSAAVGALLGALARLAPEVRQLELGDDAARSTGTRAERARLTATVIGVALTAVVTAAAGPIVFISLAAPQIARRVARTPGLAIAPAAFTGAVLLAASDVTAQHPLPTTLPVGVVTLVAGGAYLVWLLVREVRRRA